MKYPARIASCLLVLLIVAGCASTKVVGQESYADDERIARPDRILVYDLAATPDDIDTGYAAAGSHAEPSTPRTAEEIETGRQLGALVAEKLVAAIQAMGLPAERARWGAAPRVGDILLKGHFESIDKGSRFKRVVVGFGAGSAGLTTVVEGYQMTEEGLRKLGSREIASGGGGKTPGVLVPIAVTAATANPVGLIVGGAVKVSGEVTGRNKIEASAKRTAKLIADELRVAFERQGWI
ncbi:MAG: DUF4410 domain-containing protein [Deltaproteobacteria bacterium]|nr:DUF4410 domain-containing protein [Deltaproteobacteria bacterium]